MGDSVRVVMAVANPGSTDHRVVKSAEAAHKAGYECHVVGVQRDGLPDFEEINGVFYHRVPLQKGRRCLLAGLCPNCLVPNLLRYTRDPGQSTLGRVLTAPVRLRCSLLWWLGVCIVCVPWLFVRTSVRLLRGETSLSRIRCRLRRLAAGFRAIARADRGVSSFFRACTATLLRATGQKEVLRKLGLPDPLKCISDLGVAFSGHAMQRRF